MSKYVARKPLSIYRPRSTQRWALDVEEVRARVLRECAAVAQLAAERLVQASAPACVVCVCGLALG